MIPLTRQDILAHQAVVPWPVQHQIEQDLLLCRAMVALFNDPFLKGQIAMRGGTILHKAYLAPAARYSEDIDLVVVGDRPEEHIRAAIKRVLLSVLGKPKRWGWQELRLAVRNVAKPSRVLKVTYEVPSVMEPGRVLTIVVEANVTERKPHLPVRELKFAVPFREEVLTAGIISFDINEMMGTKMRALFQRQRGRDLFDLHCALTGLPVPSFAPTGSSNRFSTTWKGRGRKSRAPSFSISSISDSQIAVSAQIWNRCCAPERRTIPAWPGLRCENRF